MGIGGLLVPFLFLIPFYVLAADFSGQVVSVLDGDTIEVLHNNHAERIRLNGIDCPAMRASRSVVDFTRRG
jgi:endonuclease YncB( thermonuclease family)